MSDGSTWSIYTDGGSRGNPGPAAFAYIIHRPGEADIEEKCCLGQTTNNIAEYTGMIKALEHARELGGRKLILHSDSELMVKQMNGQYRVKNAGLAPLYQQAVELRECFDRVTFKHIRREYNSRADALCNEAMDNPRGSPPRLPRLVSPCLDSHAGQEEAPAVIDTAPSPLQRALELLRQSALRWSESGNPTDPPPAEVLQQLWAIIDPD